MLREKPKYVHNEFDSLKEHVTFATHITFFNQVSAAVKV